MLDLKKLIIDTKAVWMEFPGLEGFEVEIANLSRKELTRIRKDCSITKFDRAARVPLETLNDEKFVKQFTNATVRGWRGLTIDHLQTLILIDVEGQDLEDTLAYNASNAEILVTGSVEFDSWLNEVVFDLDNFRVRAEGIDEEITD
jgi:hypothetical protein